MAIKQMSLSGISQENLQSVMGEIELLKNLNHKNIVKYLGSFKTRTHLHIILEYMENGSLASIIKPNKFGAFPESLVAVYIAQVSVHSPQNIELALSARVIRDMGHIQGPSWQTCRAWPSLVQRDVPAMGRAGTGWVSCLAMSQEASVWTPGLKSCCLCCRCCRGWLTCMIRAWCTVTSRVPTS